MKDVLSKSKQEIVQEYLILDLDEWEAIEELLKLNYTQTQAEYIIDNAQSESEFSRANYELTFDETKYSYKSE